MASLPATTRLRYVAAKKPETIVAFLNNIGMRVQIYGSPVWDGTRWTLWFVPPDDIHKDIQSVRID